jgi:hypothetical protein
MTKLSDSTLSAFPHFVQCKLHATTEEVSSCAEFKSQRVLYQKKIVKTTERYD